MGRPQMGGANVCEGAGSRLMVVMGMVEGLVVVVRVMVVLEKVVVAVVWILAQKLRGEGGGTWERVWCQEHDGISER